MHREISIRNYRPKDAQDLANIYFHTIHLINIKDYTQSQINAWAPESSLDGKSWEKRFLKTHPLIAIIEDKIVGFAEFESNGHIDCFYCHHEWIGKGVGSALMREIFKRAKNLNIDRIFANVSITARPFFEKQGFVVLAEQKVAINDLELTNYKMEKRNIS